MMLLVSNQDLHLSSSSFSSCPCIYKSTVSSNYFIFLYFLSDASLHTIIDLSLFLYKRSSLFLAFVTLAHCGCHCYKLFAIVTSLLGGAGHSDCSAGLSQLPWAAEGLGTEESEQGHPCVLRKDEEGSLELHGVVSCWMSELYRILTKCLMRWLNAIN